jgi:hypothetical protein
MYVDDGVAVVAVIASGTVAVQLRHDRVYLHACARSSVCARCSLVPIV